MFTNASGRTRQRRRQATPSPRGRAWIDSLLNALLVALLFAPLLIGLLRLLD